MEMLGLHNLKTAKGAKTKKRRVGRGNASGKGNYSGRGMKGQKSRSGGKSGLKLRGVRTYLQRIPKNKGFKSLKPKFEEVNLTELNKNFENGSVVTPQILYKKGLVNTVKNGVKILGRGELNKKLDVEVNAFSESAKKSIIKAGGQAKLIAKTKKYPKKPAKEAVKDTK